jgi:TonB family protein
MTTQLLGPSQVTQRDPQQYSRNWLSPKELQSGSKECAMERLFSDCVRFLPVVLLILWMCPCMSAQEAQIDTLAAQMAHALSHSKVKIVTVFDIAGPDALEAMGERLAADFRAALVKSAHDFQVEDYSRLVEMFQKNNLPPTSVGDGETALWYLRETGADAAILGTLSNGRGSLIITVQAFRVRDSHRIGKFDTSIALTDELNALSKKSEKRGLPSLPTAGKNGYSSPQCIMCPSAPFSPESKQHRFQGTVFLQITADENGYAKDITVIKAQPYGLTEQAVATVRLWRFKPAIGPDGKPAAVRVMVEVVFHLY